MTRTPRPASTYRAARRNALRLKRTRGMIYTVAPAYHDRAYGGPEEGGWYYDTWNPAIHAYDRAALGQLAQPITYRCYDRTNPRMARRLLRLDAACAEINREDRRRNASSVLSRGDWLTAHIFIGTKVEREPRTRPHYE